MTTTLPPFLASRCARIAGLLIGMTSLLSLASQAQNYPSKPITIVVPFSAGGATDVTARRFAEVFAKEIGTPVVVENKPSAGSIIATRTVASAPKDGYTLLFAGTSPLSLNPLIYRTLPYEPADLMPISRVSRQAFTISMNPALPAKTVADFVAHAKNQPDGIHFGTVGVGSVSHLLAEFVGQRLGIKINTIPYKGTAQSSVDLMSGRIDLQIDAMSTGVTMHNSGKTRLLAAMGKERSILPAGVPNLMDVGYPDLVAYADFGVMAPKGTPDAVLAKIHSAVVSAVAAPEFAKKLAENGELATASASPAEFLQHIHAEQVRWTPIVKSLNLQLD